MNKICSLFGHRCIFDSENLKILLYKQIETQIHNGFNIFYIGSHGEFDKMSLNILSTLKKLYSNIEIYIVITSFSQIKKYCSFKTIFFPIETIYFKNKIIKSNQYMVDKSNLIICYVDMNKIYSGSKLAIKYAIKKNKKIINLYNDI